MFPLIVLGVQLFLINIIAKATEVESVPGLKEIYRRPPLSLCDKRFPGYGPPWPGPELYQLMNFSLSQMES